MRLVGRGFSDKQIAAELGISYRTVRTHLERLYVAHGVSGRAALVLLNIALFAEGGGASLWWFGAA